MPKRSMSFDFKIRKSFYVKQIHFMVRKMNKQFLAQKVQKLKISSTDQGFNYQYNQEFN